MPSKLKQLKTYVTAEYQSAFDKIAKLYKLNKSEFISDAISEKIKRDYGTDLGVSSAPHGVRNDALPTGWKSRLYRDRYQLIAKFTDNGFELSHYHEFAESLDNRVFDTLNAETPEPVEITVIDVPERHKNKRDVIMTDLHLAYLEWLSQNSPA